MAEMLKHEAAVACYGRWDDQDKVWNDASLMLGAHAKAVVVADVIVDTPEEIKALPDDEEVIKPVENVMGHVIKVEKTPEDEVKVDSSVKTEKDPAEASEEGTGDKTESGSGKPVPPTINDEGFE